jgi:hypothetical protein
MLRCKNPYRKFLKADGTIDRRVVMTEAWALYRADRFAMKSGPGARRAFARHLSNAWGKAKQGVANERFREAEEQAEAALIAEFARRRANPSCSILPLSLEGEAEILRQCSTDGRLPPARPQIAFAA